MTGNPKLMEEEARVRASMTPAQRAAENRAIRERRAAGWRDLVPVRAEHYPDFSTFVYSCGAIAYVDDECVTYNHKNACKYRALFGKQQWRTA